MKESIYNLGNDYPQAGWRRKSTSGGGDKPTPTPVDTKLYKEDGTEYQTKQFGNLIWLNENYANGVAEVIEKGQKSSTGIYYSYNNETTKETNGLLYDWSAVQKVLADVSKKGWRLPTVEEFNALAEANGGVRTPLDGSSYHSNYGWGTTLNTLLTEMNMNKDVGGYRIKTGDETRGTVIWDSTAGTDRFYLAGNTGHPDFNFMVATWYGIQFSSPFNDSKFSELESIWDGYVYIEKNSAISLRLVRDAD